MKKVSKRKRIFLPIARIFAVFVMGMVVAVIISLSQLNLETLRGDLVGILRDATGLPVEIDGAIGWRFSLRPRVELNDVRVPNAPWAHNPNGFMARRIDVRLNLLSLLQNRPTIQNVKIYDAAIFLEQNKDGAYSIYPQWESGDKDMPATTTEKPKYPFKDPGLGAVEVRHLTAHILESSYIITGFNVKYVPTKTGREYSGWIKSKREVYPFIVTYSEYNPERRVYPMRVALATGGDALIANIALEGTSLAPIDFIIKGEIPDIAAVGEVLNLDIMDMPRIGVHIAGGYDWNKLTLRKSSLRMRGNELKFSGQIDWSKQVPFVRAVLESERISLVELFPGLYNSGRKWHRPNRPLNVFQDTPLYGDLFRQIDWDLDADIGQMVVYRDLSLNDLRLRGGLRDGMGHIDLKTVMGDGDIHVGADIDIDPDGIIDARAGGIGERIYVGEILKQVHQRDLIAELPVNIEFYLNARGATLSTLMQTLTGPAYAYSVGSGYAYPALVANIYGTDFLTSLRHTITDMFRSEKEKDQMEISCASINVKIRDGRIETQNGVAAETNAINVQLAGNLDLGNESMRLSLATVPVRGIKLSLTGNVVNAMEINGSLAEPDIRISGAAIVGRVASATGLGMLLAPLTGGLSIVAGAGVGLLAGDLIENWLADDQPCQTAMKRGAPSMPDDPEWMNRPMAELVGSMIHSFD